MSRRRKASLALTGALAVQGLAAGCTDKPAQSTAKMTEQERALRQQSGDPAAVAKELKGYKGQKPVVEPIDSAQRRPSDSDPDLGMPAGTAYDVIRRRDIG